MAKRGVNDQYGNFSEADANALEWEFVGLNIASAHVGSTDNPASHAEDHGFGTDVSTSEAGAPEGFASKKGGGASSSGTTGGGTTGGSGTSSTGTTVGQGATTTKFATVTILSPTLNPPAGDSTLPNDTYFYKEWNLTSSAGGINVTAAWQNYTGLGIKVGIIDDGIDYKHPDLSPHYLSGLDYDAVSGGTDAYGSSTDSHGTTVAGVLAAARDGSGIVGVAYNADIAGFRISYSTGGPSQLADALNHLAINGMDVANASWGYSTPYQDNFFGSWVSSKTAIINDVAQGRGGLGIPIVFAAGNNRASGDDVNYHNYQNDPYVITVAATNDYGWVASFSTPGAAVLVSAPGSWVMTDDRLGASGWSSTDYFAAAGTSYAAPTVSGVIALMLQANPDLGYRDIQEILAYSAKNSDPGNAGWQTNGAHDWNGGGLHFDPDYGFGLVDATAAVRLAESWQKQSTYANLSTESASHVDNAAIPDGAGSLQSTITFGSSLRLDKVVVDLNITHAHVADLTVTLTSSSGTSAVLAAHPASGTGSGIVFETSANNFWGEDASGSWTLTVTDNIKGNAGTLNSWMLTAIGDAPTTPATYVYTDEFATATGSNRVVLTDTSGSATINTAAVTSGSHLDLHSGAVDTIAGKNLQIGASTVIKNVWAGDGNDTIIANDAGNTIQAGRGNDLIVAGAGADVLSGGAGSDTFQFNSLSAAMDVIRDFAVGQDAIDLHQLLATVGYVGSDPIADGWLKVGADSSGGANVIVDAHNGQSVVTVVDVIAVAPTSLHLGATPWTLVA
ncbi:S8 family serine peptidase [Bradyrhizobium arachidis]|uniref:S8 family serine peptidase n=1 Tax=Bradyrhizobium arachidis TaxID=858423 RepID=UPI002162FE62|nr:S8 family serine peptidase [Bradyrhizobium arachidis]UVO39392.1 S8 family serine peptidase [Bradyrhizobium arachidis]